MVNGLVRQSLDSREVRFVNKIEHIIKRRSSQAEYQAWITKNEGCIENDYGFIYEPKISIVIPVYNVEDDILIECIESIRGQIYKNWELCLVDDASTWDSVRRTLQKYEEDEKIHVIYRKENGHIAKTTNDGIAIADGEFIAFSDCDDVLAPNALLEVVKVLNKNMQIDFIYSDEDKLSEDGKYRHSPFFKPDWSPDTFMSLMYTNHLGVYRTSIVKEIGGLRSEVNGSQDYDFTLRFMEKSNNKRVAHIPKVLYYWREREGSAASTPQAKPYAIEANRKLKEEALRRRGLRGKVEYMEDLYQFRIVYENSDNPLVSIVIPSKDNFQILKQCLDSVEAHTSYKNYEIILVDNGSSDVVRKSIEDYIEGKNISYIYQPMKFNFSKMCNIGAEQASGEFILLLNDDIEVCQDDWLDIMVGQASLDYTGAVGVKLYYPNSNIIQHVGVVNLGVGPSHSWVGEEDTQSYYFGRNKLTYNYLAVTAACLMVSKEKYWEVGGLEEAFAVAYNDMDFCFKLYEHGYYNVVRNDVQLFHHESVSRGLDHESEEKMKRLLEERKKLYERHPKLEKYDPFYNINLCIDRNDFSLNINPMDMPTNEWKAYRGQPAEYSDAYVCVDKVKVEDRVMIEGWFTAGNKMMDDEGKVTLLFIGNVGQIVEVETDRIIRKDVAKAIETKSEKTGFRCLADNSLFHGKNKVVVKISYKNQQKLVLTDVQIELSNSFKYQINRCVENLLESYTQEQFIYNIDTVEQINGEAIIQGYVFDPNDLYNNLSSVKMLLIDKNGEQYLTTVNRTIRYDVSKAFPEIPNLVWSGFVARFELPEGIELHELKVSMVVENLLTRIIKRSVEYILSEKNNT